MMKSTLAVLALAAFLIPAQADETKEGDSPKKKGGDPAKIFKKKNTNGDDHLTLEEFTKGAKDVDKATKAFHRKDKNGDQKLTLEELSARPPKGKGKGKRKQDAEEVAG